MSSLAVIGGGAAGLMAAAAACEKLPRDARVTVFEKNEKLGKKLYITGKGRCNLTNTCPTQESFGRIVHNPKFLYSAICGFDHDAVMRFFEENGVPLKEERGGRVFPVSDHASDITRALEGALRRGGARIALNTRVTRILTENGRVSGILTSDGQREAFDAVIIATGGVSYPQTGSTGDGYRFAAQTGHAVMPQRPSLVPMETSEVWCRGLQGLSLRNVNVSLYAAGPDGGKQGKCLSGEFGEMLFTHFGVSGPVILSLSAVPTQTQIDAGLLLEIDLKPALDEETLDRRLLKDFGKYANQQMHNAMKDLLPQRLIGPVLQQSGVPEERRANTLTKEARRAIRQTLKGLRLHVTGLRDFNEAIITRGGVAVRDINASTMESKKVRGLYFAGEVIDADAVTGGYNLQIAWSTGHLAGESASRALTEGK